MATTEEQEWAERLRDAFMGARLNEVAWLGVARLVLADRAALVERADGLAADLGHAVARAERVTAYRDRLAAALRVAEERAERCVDAQVAAEAARDAARQHRAEAESNAEKLAAELEAIRGSGGVLSREECAALLGSRSGLVYGDESPAVKDAQAGARAQHARDVAVVREALGGASIMVRDEVLAALTSDAAPTVHPWTKQLELDRAKADLVAARAEVAICRARLRTVATALGVTLLDGQDDVDVERWCLEMVANGRAEVERLKASRIPPADLDGYVQVFQSVRGVPEHSLSMDLANRLDAVIAARDAWWEERLASEAVRKKPPTLHLTAEDREVLGQAVWHGAVRGRGSWSALHEDTREGWRASAVHVFTLGVDAMAAAVQSEKARAVLPEYAAVGAQVAAARAIVRVPAKEEPAPTPPTLSAEERERLGRRARDRYVGGNPDYWDEGLLETSREEWRLLAEFLYREGWTACAKAGAWGVAPEASPLPVDWRKPPKPVLSVDTIEGYEPAPAPPPPLPEVPTWLRDAATNGIPGEAVNTGVCRLLVDLVDALRAREVW